MCGILGFNWKDKELVKKMNNSLKHRGPDANGVYLDKNLSLGHRRLSILDLSKRGNQPMTYVHKGRKVIIVYNGEVYNFKEIREDLENKGYKFNSSSDTEVVLASYLEWGVDCVKKFNGMWAFCIYDIKKKVLFLSRDRLGQKPLYYYFDGKNFIFSSELKAICKNKIKLKLNKEAIDLYLSMGFIPSPYSIYRDTFKLEAGQNILFNLRSSLLRKIFYYKPPSYFPIYNQKKLISEANNLFEDSLRLRLISDVPVGAFLSGGLDSSAIVSKISKFVSLKNLHTFSIGFKEGTDETKYSNIIKDVLRTKHHHKYFTKRDFEFLLKEIYYYFDEPFFDHSMFPSVPLSGSSKKKITVSLSGDGGDEIFGGYPRYQKTLIVEYMKKIPRFLRKALIRILPSFSKLNDIKEGARLSLLKKEDFYSEARSEVYKPDVYKNIMKEKLKYFLRLSRGNLAEAVIMMDLHFLTLSDNFLAKTDRASMAKSLEVRCPFLDYRFVELSSNIPTKWKVSPFKTKILMRKMVQGYLPKEITKRKKAGFMPPIVDWVNEKGGFKKIITNLTNSNVLSKDWENFFKKILNKKDKTSQTYKTRLFLFNSWYDCWKKCISQ